MKKLLRILNNNSIIYLLSHGVVFAVGIILCLTSKVILVAVGTSMIAAGIVGWVVFTYILLNQEVSDSLEIINQFGLTNAFDGRSVKIKPQYDNLLERAHERIDIMGFGLKALREDYLPQFTEWRQKADVRILLIDPDFPDNNLSYSKQRDCEERDAIGTIAQQVHQFIQDTREVRYTNSGHSFDIRLYRCLPSVNVFRVDDELFWGPYLIKQPSRNSPTFLVHKGGLLFDRIIAHFESIWNDDNFSKSIPDNWL